MWAHLIMGQHSVQVCPYHHDHMECHLPQLAGLHVFMLLLWACLICTTCSCHQLTMLGAPSILLCRLAQCGLHYMWAMEQCPELPATLNPVSLGIWG